MVRPLALGGVVLALLGASGTSQAAIWPSAVARAEAELRSSDAGARLAAVSKLVELPRASARRLLLRALDDTEPEIASTALDLLLRLETPNVTERVVPWLSGSDKRLRLSAALALGVAPSPGAVPALGRALGDSDAEVRAAAAGALGASGSEAAVLPLLGHLDDNVPEVREAVATALGAVGDARAVLPLIGKIEDSRPPVRRAVARALGALGDARSVSALLLALRDGDRGVVIEVVRALGALGDSSAVAPLASALGAAPDPETRAALLLALGRIGSADAAEPLVRALAFDEPGREREPVLDALAQAPGVMTPALRRCVDEAVDPGQAEGCALGLLAVKDGDSASRVRAALDRGRITAKVGLRVLGELGDSRALSAALERLTATDVETRAAALDAAERLLSPKDADGRAVEPLARAVTARGVARAERLRLVALLGRTGSERALPWLVPLLSSRDDPKLVESAAAALGDVPGDAAARALFGALASDDARVQGAAALSLRRNGSAKLVDALLSLVERGGKRERQLGYLALAGPLSHATDDAPVARLEKLLTGTRGGERDDLLEALALTPRASARAALLASARSPDSADRAKVAELLAASPDAAALTSLARDADVRVRQNAVWSLGFVAPPDAPVAREALLRALGERDGAVVGNAAVALGRLARGDAASLAALCGAPLADARASVREQALRGVALSGGQCSGRGVEQLLVSDPRARVRRAAAEALARSNTDDSARRLLTRCAGSDPHAMVAKACAEPARPSRLEAEPLTLFIVPSEGAEPTPRAAFALLLPDGGLRLGVADRRGGVHEPRAPRGAFELSPYPGGD